MFRFGWALLGLIIGAMHAPFVYTEPEIAAVLRVPPEAVKAWMRRGDLRPIALTSDGRSLFSARDVEAIGRRLAAMENVRVLWPTRLRGHP